MIDAPRVDLEQLSRDIYMEAVNDALYCGSHFHEPSTPEIIQLTYRSLTLSSARDVLAARLAFALLVANPDIPLSGPGQDNGPEAPVGWRIMGASLIKRAAPILWDNQIYYSLQGVSLPTSMSMADIVIQPPLQLWMHETPKAVKSVDLVSGHKTTCGTHLCTLVEGRSEEEDDPRGIRITAFYLADFVSRGLLIDRFELPLHSRYPDDYAGWTSAFLPSLLKMLIFAASPYIPRDTRRVPRADARRAGRKPNDYPSVTFIVLRKIVPHRPDVGTDESAEQHKQWRHRWVVSGHIRNQWYPRERCHRVIYVPPYMKGPEDAPLLRHAMKVAR